jgi:hypothetical protein
MDKKIMAMKKLGMTDEEIKELMEYDKKIDRGEKSLEYDLTKEQEKVAKSVVKVARGVEKPTEKEKKERKTKGNPTKELVIAELAKFLAKSGEILAENVEIINKTRQIAFKIGENTYEIALTEKRKPKK